MTRPPNSPTSFQVGDIVRPVRMIAAVLGLIELTMSSYRDFAPTAVYSMVVHRVYEDSDDDCNGYTDVEDCISERNLRWRPRTTCNGRRNKRCGNADQSRVRDGL